MRDEEETGKEKITYETPSLLPPHSSLLASRDEGGGMRNEEGVKRYGSE